MEVQIKKTIKAGNSSAVVLPRAWLNKEVRVELVRKDDKIILNEALEIIRGRIDLSKVIGIYLVGSYARGEENEDSDIDILVVTDGIDLKLTRGGIYNIMAVSSGLIKYKLENDLFPIGQMIREAKPLLNSNYLNSADIKITKKNVKWYLDTTEDKLGIIKKAINKVKGAKHFSDLVAYTLVLRIRTLHIIRKIMENKPYFKKEFVKIIRDISKSGNAYERYLAIKNDKEDKKAVSLDEVNRLCEYLEKELESIKKKI